MTKKKKKSKITPNFRGNEKHLNVYLQKSPGAFKAILRAFPPAFPPSRQTLKDAIILPISWLNQQQYYLLPMYFTVIYSSSAAQGDLLAALDTTL